MISEIFDPSAGGRSPASTFTDITYHRAVDHGTVRIAFDRPEVRNAFRPHTVDELYRALDHARHDHRRRLRAAHRQRPVAQGRRLGVLLRRRPAHPRPRRLPVRRGRRRRDAIDPAAAGRLHILEVQRLIRFMPKVVICVVPGWAAGGGHSLHVVCDLTLASREHARFKQTDADVGQLRRRLRLGLPGPPGRPEVRPRDLLPRRRVLRRGRAPDGHGQRGRAARRARERPRCEWAAQDQRQEPDRRSGC